MAQQIVRIEVDTKKLRAIAGNLENTLDRVGRMASTAIVSDVKLEMQQSPAVGRVYEKYNPRRTHRASAAGDAPRPDTGNLMGSIHWYKTGVLAWEVADQTEYGAHLEFGTENMAARPFMGPVFEKWRRRHLRELLIRELDRLI